MENAVNQKANGFDVRSEIERLERLIQDVTQKLAGNFASKEETAKKFQQLSKRIKDIFDLLQKSGTDAEDGMFTRKALGPANCASCDKNLVNILGNPVEFSPHKKMPYRETSERIARYGQGFSKMLSTIQP